MGQRAKGASRARSGGTWSARGAAALGALTFGVLAGCRQLAGIDDVGCSPGCSVDGLARLECGAGGRVVAVACGEGSTCDGGTCSPCVDRCEGSNARLACAVGRGAEPELCPAERPLCVGGACVECLGADDCPAPSDPCVDRACEGGLCVGRPVDVSERRKVGTSPPGDCAAFFCSTEGPVELDDESDVPPSGDECTIGRCPVGGVSVAPGLAPEGESCRGGAGRCNGEGVCRAPAQLASTGDHVCAIMTDGDVWCWGRNDLNQLGDAEGKLAEPGENRSRPVHVRGFGVRAGTGLRAAARAPLERGLAANRQFTCAIVESLGDGQIVSAPKVRCWGQDDATLAAAGEFWEPRMPDLARFPVSIAAGEAFACALLDDRRSVACWGEAAFGQMGTGEVAELPFGQPVSVALPAFGEGEIVISLALGSKHACVALSSGRVLCWGSNQGGQLAGKRCPCLEGCEPPVSVSALPVCGEEASFAPIEVGPLPLNAGERVEQVRAGSASTCVVTSAGRGLCWGANVNGELGRAPQQVTTIVPPSPIEDTDAEGQSSELTSLATASFGIGQHVCGLGTAGEVICWGLTNVGQAVAVPAGSLPIGCSNFGSAKICLPSAARGPVLVGPGLDVVVGHSHSCALLADSSVQCWGDNTLGQRGNGVSAPLSDPELPPTPVLW